MDIVVEYIPRSIVMSGGEIIADGPTQEVFREQAALSRAHLVAPAAVVVSDRLAVYGVKPARSIDGAVQQVTSIRERGSNARRV